MPMQPVYLVGDTLYLNVQVLDAAGAFINPDQLTVGLACQGQNPFQFDWYNPSGDTSGTITNPSTGNFIATITTTTYQAGEYTWGAWARATVLNVDSTRTQVREESTFLLTPPTVSLT